MESIAIILSGLLSLLANGGWLIDAIAQKQLKSYIESAEKFALRVDNNPNYQVTRGKIDRLRIAGKGIYLEPNLRIASLELETDAIAIDLASLSTESLDRLRDSLQKPLQGAFSLVVTEQDLANALISEALVNQLQESLNELVASKAGTTAISYEVIAPSLELKADNQFTFNVTLRRLGESVRTDRPQELKIVLNVALEVIRGQKIELTRLTGTVNERPISKRLLTGFAEGISDRLNLSSLESQGIFARLLQLKITGDKIEIVGFARMETKSSSVSSKQLTGFVRP